jgi:adenosyl cobinamide kinase/adenosyl cobinamide phosphate guanylyltransferase
MIIYTGGRSSGKTEYVTNKYDIVRAFSGGNYFGLISELPGVGGTGYILIDDFQLVIRDMMQSVCELGDYSDEAEKLLETLQREDLRDRLIIIGCELGSGVVPIDRFLDSWREINGRCMNRLADKAEEVYIIECGIPLRIK